MCYCPAIDKWYKNAFNILSYCNSLSYCQQMAVFAFFLMLYYVIQCNGIGRNVKHCDLWIHSHRPKQIKALREEFKSFTKVINRSLKEFKEKTQADLKLIKGWYAFQFTSLHVLQKKANWKLYFISAFYCPLFKYVHF